jgi:hypothetical protein
MNQEFFYREPVLFASLTIQFSETDRVPGAVKRRFASRDAAYKALPLVRQHPSVFFLLV